VQGIQGSTSGDPNG